MAKIHIMSCDSPNYQLERSAGLSMPYGLPVDCGTTVYQARLAMMFDTQAMGQMVDFPRGVCPKCKTASDNKNSRYVYAVQGAK